MLYCNTAKIAYAVAAPSYAIRILPRNRQHARRRVDQALATRIFVGVLLQMIQHKSTYACAIRRVHCNLRAVILLPRFTAFTPVGQDYGGLFTCDMASRLAT